jgi:hypothetical protein
MPVFTSRAHCYRHSETQIFLGKGKGGVETL